MRTANPVLNEKTFASMSRAFAQTERMTIQGTVNKTALLIVLAIITASFTWIQIRGSQPALAMPWVIGGLIGGLIFGLATAFKPMWAPVTAPLYALAEGLFLGGISGLLDARYPGIAFMAVSLTFGTLLALLIVYKSGLIPVTQNFRLGVVAATGGLFFLFLGLMILRMFGVSFPLLSGNGPIGIAFSVGILIIAALNLVLDFDFIEQGADHGAPKVMEWVGAFGLMVTLVWLYVEFLRLLAKLQSRK